MKNHVKIYLKGARYSTADWIPCEVCDKTAVDIHHIYARGRGGDPQGKKDVFENLMGLCRSCHETFGDVPDCRELLIKIHCRRWDLDYEEVSLYLRSN